MAFDGETYEANRIIRQLLDIEEHCTDGSAVNQGCTCIQDRHLQALASAGQQYAEIAKKAQNKEFGRKVASWSDFTLKTVYDFHQQHPNDTKGYRNDAEEFYQALSDHCRSIRLAFEANEQFPEKPQKLHTVTCGCKGCPPCIP